MLPLIFSENLVSTARCQPAGQSISSRHLQRKLDLISVLTKSTCFFQKTFPMSLTVWEPWVNTGHKLLWEISIYNRKLYSTLIFLWYSVTEWLWVIYQKCLSWQICWLHLQWILIMIWGRFVCFVSENNMLGNHLWDF